MEIWNKDTTKNQTKTLTDHRHRTTECWNVLGQYTSSHGVKSHSTAIEVEGNILLAHAELANLATMQTKFHSKGIKHQETSIKLDPPKSAECPECPACNCFAMLLESLKCTVTGFACGCGACLHAFLTCQCCKEEPKPVVGPPVIGTWMSFHGANGEWSASATRRPGFADRITTSTPPEEKDVVHAFPDVGNVEGKQSTSTTQEQMYVIHIIYRLPLQQPTVFSAWVAPEEAKTSTIRFVQELTAAAAARSQNSEGTVHGPDNNMAAAHWQRRFVWNQPSSWAAGMDQSVNTAQDSQVAVVKEEPKCHETLLRSRWFWIGVGVCVVLLFFLFVLAAGSRQ